MLPCSGCAYRDTIPGDAHIQCRYAWEKSSHRAPRASSQKVRHWFHFPWNYDPTWGPDACPARAEITDESMLRKPAPLTDILSLLAKRIGS